MVHPNNWIDLWCTRGWFDSRIVLNLRTLLCSNSYARLPPPPPPDPLLFYRWTSFHTTCSTMKGHGTHMLSVLADRQFGIEVDGEGYLFLDRDPAWFSGVLPYLRGCCHFAPDPLRADFTLAVDSALNLTAFLREAQCYQIQGLCGMLKERRLLALRELWPCIAVINDRSSTHQQPGHVDVHLYDIAAQVWHSKSYVRERYENTDFLTCSDGRFIYMTTTNTCDVELLIFQKAKQT